MYNCSRLAFKSQTYRSPNRRVARNKRGDGKDEPFLISVMPGISMVVKIFRSVTVIKIRKKWIIKFLIKKNNNNSKMVQENKITSLT